MKTINIDVDLCVVNPLWNYAKWIDNFIPEEHKFDVMECIEQLGYRHFDGMESIVREWRPEFRCLDYWERGDIYDDILPIPYSDLYINQLHSDGYKINFVSHCCGKPHVESKLRFLSQFFKYDGFYDTGDKYTVPCDIMIDDRPEYLYPMCKHQPHAHLFLYETPTNCNDYKEGLDIVSDWKTIYSRIKTNY